MAAEGYNKLKGAVHIAQEENRVTFPANVNDLTDEDDDSADVLDIPVNVEIITDEEEVGDDSEDSPPTSKKIRTSESYAVGSVTACKIETLRERLKGKSARECFEEFFTDELLETIVRETERYASTAKNKQDFSITVTDLKIFIGFMIFAGYHRLPCERDYWSDDEDLGIPLVKAAMTRNAFAEIKACLHFQDNAKACENQADRSFKIRPLIEMLNKNFQKWDVLHDSLSMGEIVVPCYGINRVKRKKPLRVGYKLGVLCGDGYCYKFWLYGGQPEGGTQVEQPIVKELQSPENTQLRANFLEHFRLLSEFKPETNQQQVTNKKCGGNVKYYELLLRRHSIPIRGKKWYWCLITRMIDMAIVNAYHIFRETQDAHKCLKDFRREIAVPYLKLGHCRRISRSLAPNPSRTHVNEDVRFDGLNHIIGKREKQRRCQFQNCKGRPKTYCVKCNITLCTTCFPQFHFRANLRDVVVSPVICPGLKQPKRKFYIEGFWHSLEEMSRPSPNTAVLGLGVNIHRVGR